MAKQIKHQIEDFLSHEDASTKMKLNLGQIDCMVNGIGKGNLVAFIGQPIDGRDLMMNTLIKNLAIDQNVPSLIMNLVTTETSFYELLASNLSGIMMDDLSKEDILESRKLLEDAEVYVDFPVDRKLDSILSTIKEHVEKGIKLVFIDLVQAVDYVGNINIFCEEELIYFDEKITRRLSQLAKDLKIIIIVGAAVSYLTWDREDGYGGDRPQLEDLKMAHRLDKYCDLALGLYIPEEHQIYYNGKEDLRDMIEVTILKNRINFKKGRFYMYYNLFYKRIIDNKTYNEHAAFKQMKKNRAFKELVAGIKLELEDGSKETI